MEEEGGKEKKLHEKRRGRKKTQRRDLNFLIRVVILQGRADLCLSAPPGEAGSEAGRAAIAFHWQADKQGAAWRQKGHYQRLGQTEIRASFGPGRQASTHTHKHTHFKTGESFCTLDANYEMLKFLTGVFGNLKPRQCV